MAVLTNRWVVCNKPSPSATMRLLCFPFAGGGASIYRAWGAALSPQIEVLAVQLPGRETRLREPLYTDVHALTDELLTVLTPYLDMPFAFFGHSMGALIAFELARRLRQQGNGHLVHLFVSARSAPQVLNAEEPIYHLPTTEFIAKLRQLNGTPEIILQNAELQQMILPVLRADLELNETYSYTAQPPLDVPISAFAGQHDPRVTQESVAHWSAQTSKTFALRVFAGDHFFVNTHQAELLQAIQQDARSSLR